MATATPVLEPTGTWTVDYGDAACTLGRQYGPSSDPVILGLRPSPLGQSIDVMVARPGKERANRAGSATIVLTPGGTTFGGDAVTAPMAAEGRRVTSVTVKDAGDALRAATRVTVMAPQEPDVSLATPGMAGAWAALETCQDNLLKDWKLDPAAVHRVASRAVASNEAMWIAVEDYPPQALRAQKQGTARIHWTIGTDAKVTDCRIVVSSGDPDLDRASCGGVVRRAVYRQPARDRDGHPVVSYGLRQVSWRLPG